MGESRGLFRAAAAAVLAVVVTTTAGVASAQPYPSRPIRVVSFVPSGSSADALLRVMAAEVARSIGSEVVVENKPGGSGAVAASAVRGSAPDGYTLLLAGSSVMLSSMLKGAADPFAGFVPVSQVISTPIALGVRSDLGARSVAEVVQLAKASPGKISYATAGTGSYAHVMMELLSRRAGVKLLHVPYPQLSQAIGDMVTGRIDGVFSLMGTMQPQATAGKIHFVGTTGEKRSPVAAHVPTFVEAGFPDMGMNAWNGLFAPAGTPPAIVEQLATEFSRAARTAKAQEFAGNAALEATATSHTEFRDHLVRERAYWARVIDETGVKPQ